MRNLLGLLILALVAAPVAAQKSSDKKSVRRQANLITAEEINPIRSEVPSAYELIQRLRPQYLRTRGATGFGNAAGGQAAPTAKVVIDGAPRGDLSMLRQVSTMSVEEIRYLNSSDASIRFGTGFDGGAILIITRVR